MADLVAQFGIDDSAFERGVRQSERTAIDSANRVYTKTRAMAEKQAREQQSFASKIQTAYTKGWAAVEKGMSSVIAAGYLVARSVGEYGEKFSYARGQAEDLERAVDRFKTSLGRDLSSAGGGNILASVIDWGSRARETLADLTAASINFYTFGLVGNNINEIEENNALRKRLEQQDVEAQRAKTLNDNQLGLQIRDAEASGDGRLASQLRAKQRKRQASERIAGLGLDGEQARLLREQEFATIEREEQARIDRLNQEADRRDAAGLQRTRAADLSATSSIERRRIEAQARALRESGRGSLADATLGEYEIGQGADRLRQQGASAGVIDRFIASEREALQQKIALEEAEREEKRQDRVAELEHGQKMFRVEALVRDGKKKEAEILRAQLETERVIAQLRTDSLLNPEDKGRFIEAEQQALAARIEGIRNQKDDKAKTRVLGSGLAGALTRETVLGGGKSIENIAGMQLTEAKKQTALLATIADNGGNTL